MEVPILFLWAQGFPDTTKLRKRRMTRTTTLQERNVRFIVGLSCQGCQEIWVKLLWDFPNATGPRFWLTTMPKSKKTSETSLQTCENISHMFHAAGGWGPHRAYALWE